MLSNVIESYVMHSGMSGAADDPLFAAWYARVLQHVILLPALLVSFWASLRIQWHPLWSALPLQMCVGAAFAALAFPALLLAMAVLRIRHGIAVGAVQSPSTWREPSNWTLWFVTTIDFLFTYCFGLALVMGFSLYRRIRDAELQVASLEREWSAARLAALRMQLSPHTLFNWLHTIRGNIEWDPQAAQSMIVQLADLLRRLLNAGERELSSLTDELQFVRSYLELQQRRFADRLRIILPNAGDVPAVWVPSLILQPLVENAVVHGLAGHQGPVEIQVTAQLRDEGLRLTVVNSVAPCGPRGDEGIGLRNVRERLAVQYGDRASMSAAIHGSDWTVQLVLPVQYETPPART
jgi:signal transduction histidine kinase